MKITAPPEHIASILEKITSEGFDAFLVGGCVRDTVMGRAIHDWDLATSAAPVDVARLFSKTILTGEKFGTVSIVLPDCTVEVTTFRTEGEYQDGRRPKNVEFVTSLEDDLSRRDFTINAMAVSIEGKLIDPYGGIKDIQAGIIRCVGGPNTRFSEDALRMFRALRLAAELGFEIEPDTLQAIYANAGMAARISTERIRIEMEKTLMSKRPEITGEMIMVGLLERYMIISGKRPDGLEKIAELPFDAKLRWCAFVALLSERRYISSAADLLNDLHLDSKTVKTCLRALTIENFPDDRTGIKRLLSNYDIDAVRCSASASDIIKGGCALSSTDEIIASGECIEMRDLALSGSDLIELGYPPGRELGDTLKKLLEYVLENPECNERDTLLGLVETGNL